MKSWTQVKLEWTNGYEVVLNVPIEWQPDCPLHRFTILENGTPSFVVVMPFAPPGHVCDSTCMCFASRCDCPVCAPIVAALDARITDLRPTPLVDEDEPEVQDTADELEYVHER